MNIEAGNEDWHFSPLCVRLEIWHVVAGFSPRSDFKLDTLFDRKRGL